MAIELTQGQDICYVRGAEQRCRPARLLSDGVTEVVMGARGEQHHVHLEYYDLPYTDNEGKHREPRHSFEVQRAWDTTGSPDTWHLPDQCPFNHDPKRCPFVAAAAKSVEAPPTPSDEKSDAPEAP